MRRWVPYPFLRIVCAFILGILAQGALNDFYSIAVGLFLLSFLLYCFLFYFSTRPLFSRLSLFPGVVAFVAIFLAGYIHAHQYTTTNNPRHFAHIEDKVDFFQAQVISTPKTTERSISVKIALKSFYKDDGWHEVGGDVLLYVGRDKEPLPLAYGDNIILKGAVREIQQPLNPAEFNYKRFLSYQNIYHSAFVMPDDVLVYPSDSAPDIFYFAYKAQTACRAIINENIQNASARDIVLALLLGVKDDLDKPLQQAYATAGVMHILAVSGLHVGIIYMILLLIFGSFSKGKYSWWFAGVCLLTLWVFAFITGLSPSVLRAVTMFSFIIVAKAAKRQTNIYNTLAASAFILLCFDPFLIMAVGFQLSYMAVLGIVYFFPKIYPLLDIDIRWLDYVWKLMAVSLAAQIAVFPLSIYYFNQFPPYFLLANIIMVPAAFLMLTLGLGLLLASVYPPFAAIAGKVLEFIVIHINQFVFGIQSLPFSNVSGIYITATQALLLILLIVLLIVFFEQKKFYWMVLFTCALVLFQGITMVDTVTKNNTKKITYFSLSNSGVLAFVEGGFLKMIETVEERIEEDEFNYKISPSFVSTGHDALFASIEPNVPSEDQVEDVCRKSFPYGQLLVWNQLSILIIDRPIENGWALKKPVSVDILLVENDAFETFDSISSNIQCKQIIIGNSCSYTVAAKLKKGAENLEMKIRHPLAEGAYILYPELMK